MHATPTAPEVRRELEREVRRVAERLRTLTPARLAEAVPGHASRADAGRAAAQTLADCAAAVEGDPVRRMLPVLADLAVADQVQVTGTDLLLAAAAAPVSAEALLPALEQLRAVRRAI